MVLKSNKLKARPMNFINNFNLILNTIYETYLEYLKENEYVQDPTTGGKRKSRRRRTSKKNRRKSNRR
jgi:hypothetical protein